MCHCDPVNRERLIGVATVLSAVGAVITFMLGLGAGLSEDPGYWVFWLLSAIFAAVTVLCVVARDRS